LIIKKMLGGVMSRVIIVGGGASVKEGIKKNLWDKIKDEEIWALNYAFLTMPYNPSHVLFVDIDFYSSFTKELSQLSRCGVKIIAARHSIIANSEWIETHYVTREREFYNTKVFFGNNGMTGLFALSLAVKKFDEVYLLGYDWGIPSVSVDSNDDVDITHYYQSDLDVKSSGFSKVYMYLDKNGNPIKNKLRDFDVYLRESSKIYNVSVKSNIEQFEKISYDEFFKQLYRGRNV